MFKMASLYERVMQDGLLGVLWLFAGAVAASLLYSLCLLVVAAAADLRRRRRYPVPAPLGDNPPRFLVLIPAHDEESTLPAALEALSRLSYPARPRVVVVADNCADQTASAARRFDGVQVLERFDLRLRGKGHALNWALAQLLPARDFDLVVVIDADTQMDCGFLAAMARAHAMAGQGSFAAQGWYDVLNAAQSWRTALMAGALSLVHYVRPLAREQLGLSCGLKGNGMCLSASLLAELAWRGDSLTEDIEYGLDLVELKRQRVRFVPDAVVRAQMPATSRAAGSQRRRWEGGRYRLARSRGLGLLAEALVRRNRLALDCALDLLAPPLAELAAAIVAWGLLLAAAASVHLPGAPLLAWLWAGSAAAFGVDVLCGFAVGRAPRAAYRALAFAPVYVAWKMLVYAARRRDEGWVRTERAANPAHAASKAPVEAAEVVNK